MSVLASYDWLFRASGLLLAAAGLALLYWSLFHDRARARRRCAARGPNWLNESFDDEPMRTRILA